MKSSRVLPVAEKVLSMLESSEVTIFDWDYPVASISAKIQTYRSDFFQEFTHHQLFRVINMHNLKADSNEWFMDIQFNKVFEEEAVPLYWKNKV